MEHFVILKCNIFANCENVWETSNIDPCWIIDILTTSSMFYSIDQNHKKIEKMNLFDLLQYSNDRTIRRNKPDLILIDNPMNKKIEDITCSDFDIMMRVFSDSECAIDRRFSSIQNNMLLYAHDYNFYNVFYSNLHSVDYIMCRLLEKIFSNTERKVCVLNNEKIGHLSELLKSGFLINISKCQIEKKVLTLTVYVHNDSKFSELLYPRMQIDNFFEFCVDINLENI